MTRRIRYQVACSLDGYIAGPDGQYDWIVIDPEIDFEGLYAQFDTFLMGRKTYETSREFLQGKEVVVVSRTLRQADHPGVRIIAGDVRRAVDELRTGPGKDIWLYGGGELFGTLLANGQVDTVEPAVIPILLGGGIPMVPPGAPRTALRYVRHRLYEKSGIMLVHYDVLHGNG